TFSPLLPLTCQTGPSAVSRRTSPTDQPAACSRAKRSPAVGRRAPLAVVRLLTAEARYRSGDWCSCSWAGWAGRQFSLAFRPRVARHGGMNIRPRPRRLFLAALPLALAALAACADAPGTQPGPQPKPALNYIDAHVHVWTDHLQRHPLGKGWKAEAMLP